MPTYEYECTRCGAVLEVFQRISDPPLEECPKEVSGEGSGRCGGRLKRRISGGAGLLFKGSGFYLTDYRSESYKKAAKAEKELAAGGKAGEQKQPSAGEAKPSA
ncbi:putative regulatory protein, FmdB family [Methylacidimicrobium sp. AP8]|uniref:FmdB family zinc ribbon protein n=1 Tax=Methylacidimicrobium sp. AP8 TaxID=2730359 RepID=UPI0018C0DD5C|nr:FmdB family zinc ribbon protein [Methylacidimicrobium sp. AP8]CAB4244137.1 putative regulatory protein, FmdB family [Methylacidimicrobium sp. AP8]